MSYLQNFNFAWGVGRFLVVRAFRESDDFGKVQELLGQKN